jgi:hypothetical protein
MNNKIHIPLVLVRTAFVHDLPDFKDLLIYLSPPSIHHPRKQAVLGQYHDNSHFTLSAQSQPISLVSGITLSHHPWVFLLFRLVREGSRIVEVRPLSQLLSPRTPFLLSRSTKSKEQRHRH